MAVVDDDRLQLESGEKLETGLVRFRTLDCYTLAGTVELPATSSPRVTQKLLLAVISRSAEVSGQISRRTSK